MTTTTILPCGRILLMDEEDFVRYGNIPWRALRSPQKEDRFYAHAWGDGGNLYLHRKILEAPQGITVDHINGDGLDNQRSNIRLATRSQNNANRAVKNVTGFRGVSRYHGGFRAFISSPVRNMGRKSIHLGCFDAAEDAARAYDRAALDRWGDYARLNFPQQEIVNG